MDRRTHAPLAHSWVRLAWTPCAMQMVAALQKFVTVKNPTTGAFEYGLCLINGGI